MSKESLPHPDYYQTKKGFEVIDVIDAFTSDLQGVEAFDTANIIKYICRWKKKNGVEDLRKASWYIDHLIEHVTKSYPIGKAALFDCDKVIFSSRFAAESVLDELRDRIICYGRVSVTDFYELSKGSERVANDRKYGWRNLDSAVIEQVKDGWMIEFPNVVSLN